MKRLIMGLAIMAGVFVGGAKAQADCGDDGADWGAIVDAGMNMVQEFANAADEQNRAARAADEAAVEALFEPSLGPTGYYSRSCPSEPWIYHPNSQPPFPNNGEEIFIR